MWSRTAVVAAIAVAATAIRTATRKLLRTASAIVTVTKRHVPAWLGAVLTICLLIPGPVDELLVLLVIGAMAAFKPRCGPTSRRPSRRREPLPASSNILH